MKAAPPGGSPGASQIEAWLADARRARADGRVADARTALSRAVSGADTLGGPLRQVARWRLAKLHLDDGSAADALAAVGPLLADADPFEHHPSALDGVGPLATAWQDTHGYGAPVLRTLLEAARAAHRRRGDPVRASLAGLTLAWDLGCAGDLDALGEELDAWAATLPASLAGPSRHPRAADGPSSLPWLQLEAAQTSLRAATWGLTPALARRASEVLFDALDDLGLELAQEFWAAEPLARATLTFGWDDRERAVDTWLGLAPPAAHPRRDLHAAFADAERARRAGDARGAARRWIDAAGLARDRRLGAEWEIDALLGAEQAVRSSGGEPDPAWRERARERVGTHGVGVFGGRVTAPRATTRPGGDPG